MRKISLFSLLLLISVVTFAQSKMSPNTRQLITSMKMNELSETNTNSLLKNYVIRNLDDEKYVNAYIHLSDGNSSYNALEQLGVKINSTFTGVVTASVPVNKLEEIAGLDEVKYIQVGTPVHKLMDKSRAATMVDDVQSGLNLSNAFLGTGVVIGIVDMGFEYGHSNFYNYDKTDLRVKRVWNQNGKTGTPPKGFSYGTELKTKDEIINAKYDENTTHGTHVAGIAAGADTVSNSFYGVAGDAEIVLVSLGSNGSDADNTSVSDGVKYIFDYATSVNKPCVVNLSLGSHVGPHDGTSTFDVISDQLQGKGRLIAGAAGNEGGKKLHISKTFTSELNDTLSTFINFPQGVRQGYINIWGEVGMKYTVQMYMYDRNKKTVKRYYDIIDTSVADGDQKTIQLNSGADGARGYITVISEISPLNEKPHVSIFPVITSLSSAYNCIGFTIRPLSAGTVHAWTESVYSEFASYNLDGYTQGDDECSVGEIGGSGKRIITVGAYVSKNNYKDFGGTNRSTAQKLNSIASFSSLGPTADGRIKPEVTAPGSTIASSISSYTDDFRYQIIVNQKTWKNKTYSYAMMDGTSMATPCVVGILATWLQAYSELTPEDVKGILQRTSIQDSYTGVLPEEGDNTWGHGKINAWEGLKETLRMNPAGIESETVKPVILLPTGNNGFNLLFTSPSTNTNVSIFDVNGKKVYGQSIHQANPGEEIPISVTGTTPGLYIIKISSDQSSFVSKMILE